MPPLDIIAPTIMPTAPIKPISDAISIALNPFVNASGQLDSKFRTKVAKLIMDTFFIN
jgi:hypothetical protein